VKVLKLGFTYPHPKAVIGNFLKGLEKVLVVEELEPFLEEAVKVIAHDEGIRYRLPERGRTSFPGHSSSMR